ncbi:MAG: tetratricopeptide repeat protein [bacterium]
MNKRLIWVNLILIILLSSGCVALPHKPTPKTPQEIARALEQENFDLATAYNKAGMLEEALYFSKEVLKLNPQHQQAQELRDKILDELKKEKTPPTPEEPKQEPLPSLKEIQPLPAKEISPLKEKEAIAEIEGLPEKEVKLEIKKVPTQKPPAVPELPFFEFAKELRTKRLYADAITELSNILNDYPNTPLREKIDFELANNYFDQAQYDKALNLFSQIMTQKKDLQYDAQLMLAKCYEKTGDHEKAKIEYLRLIKRLNILTLPKIEEVSKEVTALKSILDKTTPLPQKKEDLEAEAHFGVGNVSRARREYRQALVEYDNTIKKSPKSPVSADAAFYIADIYDNVIELRDYEQAVNAYTRVISDYPDSKWIDRAKERKKYLIDNYL